MLPKSAEKESGPGQPCMTNASLTPSVPLSTSKDKSCMEYKHWILPCDHAKHCVGYIIKHWDFKNEAEMGQSILRRNGVERFCMLSGNWWESIHPIKMTFQNSQWKHRISFFASDLCRPLLEFFCLFWQRPANIIQACRGKPGGGVNRSGISIARSVVAWP